MMNKRVENLNKLSINGSLSLLKIDELVVEELVIVESLGVVLVV